MNQVVQVQGFRELEKLLKELGKEPARRALRSAVRAGANVIKSEALLAVPVGSEAPHPKYGRLKDNLKVVLAKTGAAPVEYSVSVGRAFWGMFQEFGTRFQPARPWLRPAFDHAKIAALKTIETGLGKSIEREAMKLANKHGTKRKR